jgi:hypothetical protein
MDAAEDQHFVSELNFLRHLSDASKRIASGARSSKYENTTLSVETFEPSRESSRSTRMKGVFD